MNSLFNLIDDFINLPEYDLSDSKHYPVPSFPKADVFIAENGSIVFSFSLAGYKREDLDISFMENHLVLSTSKDFKPEQEDNRKYLVKNIKKCSFKYSYFVPETKYDFNKVEATLNNGMLTIIIPPLKEVNKRPQSIKIM